jgi:sugar fermentation stimulation protein A
MKLKLVELSIDAEGVFIDRPNRFLGIVDIVDNNLKKIVQKKIKVHIHDPGRLKEILYTGNRVHLKRAPEKTILQRATGWDIVAGYVEGQWVLVHSGYHRIIAEAILRNHEISPFGKIKEFSAEVQFGHSRLDFLITEIDGKKIFVEVKGCTLAVDSKALFPDAPTLRGSKHLRTLIDAKTEGYEASLMILIFRADSKCFAPNSDTDPLFTKTFKLALEKGIKVYPILLSYENGGIYYQKMIPVCKII